MLMMRLERLLDRLPWTVRKTEKDLTSEIGDDPHQWKMLANPAEEYRRVLIYFSIAM